MKIATVGAVLLLGLLTATKAEAASILYTTTDLGTSSQTLVGAGGEQYGTTGLNGVIYAFDKTPVTKIDIGGFNVLDNYSYLLTMQAGNFQVGTAHDHPGPGSPFASYPSFLSNSASWLTDSSAVPVSDINIQGQVVGVGNLLSVTASGYVVSSGTFAAFSAVGLKDHTGGGPDYVVDNLNNYIATIPGVYLTSAVAIDDLGRIIADGSNGHAYLLTPETLGPPATAPEPSTVLIFGVAGSLFGLRSIRRRWGRRSSRPSPGVEGA
jgi:hypothetical protein